LNFYVASEKLSGDNQYRCSTCNDQLRDASKFVAITKAPQHLIITLNRFSYDLDTQSRKKITQEVQYPDWLDVPVLGTLLPSYLFLISPL
jgi:ubiquitin carboxyl-terminal hydrolase 35/38